MRKRVVVLQQNNKTMKQRGFWKIRSSKIIYKNRWISVREDKVVKSGGKAGIFGIVTIVPGLSVIPIDDKGNVYLTKEFHYAINKINIEAASGGINKKENRLSAARRELKEETGLTAKKWTYLGRIDPFTNLVYCPTYLYLAQDLRKGKPSQDETENIEVIKIPFKKAIFWVKQGKITHSPTCVALLKAQDYLNKS